MAVNLPQLQASTLYEVPGIQLGYAMAGIKKPGRKDVLLITLSADTTVAGVFTRNRFCAAPVQVCQEHLAAQAAVRALIINTGNANAGTAQTGLNDARSTCQAVAQLLHLQENQVLPFSTGVILEPLPLQKILHVLPLAQQQLRSAGWFDAANAIMTTDTLPKAYSLQKTFHQSTVTMTGISKGAGMIHPNMATMLGFIGTDASIPQELLQELTQEIADLSFNAISIDGDTSTNDSFIVMATGKSGLTINHRLSPGFAEFREMLLETAQALAQQIVRDGEGATKFMTVQVQGGKSLAECQMVGEAIAHSPLVKTAFFASDPNLGRILAAVGYAGISDLDVSGVQLWLGDVWVAKDGGRHPDYLEIDGQRVMQESEIRIRVDLGRGEFERTMWTCDFSLEYVSINADYRS